MALKYNLRCPKVCNYCWENGKYGSEWRGARKYALSTIG